MENELCRLLSVPPTLVAFRDRARAKLIPTALGKQIEIAGQQRLAAGEGIFVKPRVLEAHLRMKRNVRHKLGALAKAGWKTARGGNQNARHPSS